ncbi:MAG: endo alpha-1,4 polygalactosaminidase [Hyphomicrobiaceae bacterium]
MSNCLDRVAAFLACVLIAAASLAPASASGQDRTAQNMKELLQLSSNWTYQLQGAKPRELADTSYDVIVMDAFFGGGRRDVERLRKMPFGKRRLILSYLSIGEAEVYRHYWQRCCSGGKKPDWIWTENKQWPGNYRVRFWNDEWKSILYEDAAENYVKQIVALGFDGIYLDRIDVYQDFPKGTNADGSTPRAQMIRLVQELSRAARRLNPSMLIVAQNAEDLASEPSYLSAIDAIAKEDLLFGVNGDGRRNQASMIKYSIDLLQTAHAAGKHIMVVEYLKDPAVIERARTEILELGFVPYFAPRGLERLQVENLELDDSH